MPANRKPKKATANRKAAERKRIPRSADKRRRDPEGQFQESDDTGRSLSPDTRRKGKTAHGWSGRWQAPVTQPSTRSASARHSPFAWCRRSSSRSVATSRRVSRRQHPRGRTGKRRSARAAGGGPLGNALPRGESSLPRRIHDSRLGCCRRTPADKSVRSVSRSCKLTGFTRWPSQPASSDLSRSAS